MLRDDRAIVLDIFLAARRIVEFLQGVSEEQFRKDEMRKSAVMHQLLILGEAVKRLSPAFRDAHPEIPWAAMAGLRDRLIHAYHKVDIDRVAETAYQQVPRVLQDVELLVPKETD